MVSIRRDSPALHSLLSMTRAATTGSWLAPHQAQVLYTAAHVDATIQALIDTLHPYLASHPLQIGRRLTETEEQAVLIGIRPLPEGVPRQFADAVNQCRNALEHALTAEIRHRVGRELTEKEARAVEVPAAKDAGDFMDWHRHPGRRSLGVLTFGSEISNRLERLQPYHRNDSESHPLRVLVEHTNFAKHRAPTLALTRVGRVDVGEVQAPLGSAEHQEIMEIGTVLASVPRGDVVPVDVWPQVMVQRPHTGEWRTLMKELAYVEEWVRRQALPIILEGRTDLSPIRPHLDLTVGYTGVEEAWAAAGATAATDRGMRRMIAHGLRENLADMLVGENGEAVRTAAEAWTAVMSDAEVIATFEPVGIAAKTGDLETVARLTDEWRVAIGLEPRGDDEA